MAAKTFIYFRPGVGIGESSTTYQVTTTATDAVGAGKILVSVAQNAAVASTFALTETSLISGDMIIANTVTAGKMSVTTLSSIVANLGTITAGNMTLDSSGYIRGGATDYLTGIGFYVGYSGGAYKLSIGNPSTEHME